MEVMGSVIVGDVDNEENKKPQIQGGFADLGRVLKEEEKDNVPRILVTRFRRQTKASKLHSVFSGFGTITYLAMKGQQAVLEFSSRSAVNEVLKCKFLKVHGAVVRCEPLQKFLHVEKDQFEVDLNVKLVMLDNKEKFDQFVAELCRDALEKSSSEQQILCKKIESVTRAAYPHCKAYPFGSRVTQLGLQGCDLDIFLDCGKMYNGEIDQSPRDQQTLGETVLKQMIRCEEFTRISKVLNARVPILKFFHNPTNTYGDIAFRNGLGVENTKLLIFLQSLDSRLHPILLFVKMWGRMQNLRTVTEQFHFTSYALVMMAVFYLQQLEQPLLPPISALMAAHKGEQQYITGWPCSFSQDKRVLPRIQNQDSVLELVKGFFKFYKSFHFEFKVICPYLGKAIERKDIHEIFNPDTDLASLFPTYTEKLQEGGEYFPARNAICVQDPFEHSHNLTRGVKEEVLMCYMSSCGLMYNSLNAFS